MAAHYTFANPYQGPDGDGTLDGRITRNGDGDDTYDPGEVVPVTILHHNDSHGNLLKGTYVGLHPAGHPDQPGARSQPDAHPAGVGAATTSRATR